MTEHAETIAFRPRQRRTQARVKRRRRQLAERRPARVARRLALAHRIAADIEAGRYKDYADVARRHGLTRARLTQLMTTACDQGEQTTREHRRCESEGRDREAARNLLLLAPDIQEEVLALEFPVGREPVTERTLRRVLASLCWEDQRAAWVELRPEADLPV